MRTRREWEVDHLDPRWKEGRDYQLICGLDCLPNLNELDRSFNDAKSNRFLPWRWSREEVGVVPQEPGDLCLFLDPDTDEWVLEEYLGEWWFSKTKKLCGSNLAGQKLVNWRSDPEKEAIRAASTQKWKDNNPDKFRQHASRGVETLQEKMRKDPSILARRNESIRKVRLQCTVTGYISTPCGLASYQKARGIDPSNRRRVDSNDER
jgi:hypothetical protein